MSSDKEWPIFGFDRMCNAGLVRMHTDWITRRLGHEDERTTLRSYCYNYNLPDGMELTIENVLSAGKEYIDRIA